MSKVIRSASRFASDVRGSAAAEFAIVATLLIYMMLNVVDMGMYIYARMEVENAAQAAAEKVISACESTTTVYDVTANCPSLATVIQTAGQQTSLGTGVTVAAATSSTEAFYCANGSGGMTKDTLSPLTSTSSSNPTCLLTVPLSTAKAGDYLPLTATYTFRPIFPGATVSSLLGTSIAKTIWIRVA